MNLRGIVNKYTQKTNPNININWIQSTGYVTDDTGRRTPTTITLTVEAQIQALNATELTHTDGLNISGVKRSVYMYGNVAGIVRTDKLGGDILVFPEIPNSSNKNWLVTQVLETWPDWCHVIVTLQD